MNRTKQVVLAINPGSTSTKIALFSPTQLVWQEQRDHTAEDISSFANVASQFGMRLSHLDALLTRAPQEVEFQGVVGRGGLLQPLASGTYAVNRRMLDELREARWGEHASNLGALLAHDIALRFGVPSFIVDPVVVDELEEYARLSGWPDIERRSIFHALNHKAVGRRAALELGRSYPELALVVAHLGGGITVGAHRYGRVIEVNNGLDGEGPFSPERCGGLPLSGLIAYAARHGDKAEALASRIAGRGGLVDHLGTNDAREVEKHIAAGNQKFRLVYEAMAYQIAKEIGRCVGALGCRPHAIVLTGGLAFSTWLVERIQKKTESMAHRFLVYPGEDELSALAEGAWRVLDGLEEAREYS